MNDPVPLAVIPGILVRAGSAAEPSGDHPTLRQLRSVLAEFPVAVDEALEEERVAAESRPADIARETCHKRAMAAGSHCTSRPMLARTTAPPRGGMAGWQIARVTSHIAANIGSTIHTHELAALARLSSFHFCRVFRGTFGTSPHRYVMRKRVERAQELMLTTDSPLAEIAVDCGMADQAHFNKVFRKLVGETPGAWRRARGTGPGAPAEIRTARTLAGFA